MKNVRSWHVAALAAIALPALWLLLAGPERVLGLDAGRLGMALLVTAAWSSLLALSMLPRGEGEAALAPGEWKAWIGLGFMLVATLYFLVKLRLFAGESFPQAPLSSGVARDLVMLLVAWVVLSQVVAARWKGRVEADERDREIEANAAEWGRGGLVFCVIGLAVLFGFSPAERMQWATPFMVANLLVFALMWGWLVEYAASVALYVRDRRR
ncbi:MAG: hypothetical protein KIS72_07790 [Luteimonas sp.]|nr:hypothetical protein [Luteimonas sp.]